jgi:hypothetical protein
MPGGREAGRLERVKGQKIRRKKDKKLRKTGIFSFIL